MAHEWRTVYEPGRCLWLFVREARTGAKEVLVHCLTARRAPSVLAAFAEADEDSAQWTPHSKAGGEGETA